jgi:hypothetical protein
LSPKSWSSVTLANFGEVGQIAANGCPVMVLSGGGAHRPGETPLSVAPRKMSAMDDERPATYDFRGHRPKTASDYYRGIYGTRLRHAALAILMNVRSCSLSEMWDYLQRRHRIDESVTRKTLADAMRHECAKGRAVHDGYGRYRVGKISTRTKRRIVAESREIAFELGTEEYVEHLIDEEERRIIARLVAERERAEARAQAREHEAND